MGTPKIEEKEKVPIYFGEKFVTVDEDDAATSGLEAPKKENFFFLVEMSKDQLAAFEAGASFYIKEHGKKSTGCAALCTPDKTFGLEFLENSNPMYLGSLAEVERERCEDGDGGAKPEQSADKENVDVATNNTDAANTPADAKSVDKDVVAKKVELAKKATIFSQVRGNMFMKTLSPDSQTIRDLLMPHSIESSQADTPEGRSSPVTFSQLEFQVAASKKELADILEQGPYAENNGSWYFLPTAFERQVTDVALSLASLHSWDTSALKVDDLFRAVQGHFGEESVPSSEILCNLLRALVRNVPAESDKAATDSAAGATDAEAKAGILSLDPEKIKIFQATQLMREPPSRLRERFELPVVATRPKRPRLGAAAGAGREAALRVEELCAAFAAQTGCEMSIEDLSKLVGDRMYIDEMDGAVHPLDVAALPQDPRERLKRLFELSSHWRPERLAPLMTPVVHGIKIDAWLLKYVKVVFVEFEKDKEIRMMTNKFAGMK